VKHRYTDSAQCALKRTSVFVVNPTGIEFISFQTWYFARCTFAFSARVAKVAAEHLLRQ